MILNRLREATHELHVLLESKTMMNVFHSGNISRNDYIFILKRFYQFLLPIEGQFNNLHISKYVPDFPGRRKLILLSDDLKQLETNVPIEDEVYITEIRNTSEAMGVLYVLEGSTLGGVQISKQLQSQLQIFPENGGSFFYGYGSNTGKMWKQFIQDLTNYADSTDKEEEVISGAVKAFTVLYNCLQTSVLQ